MQGIKTRIPMTIHKNDASVLKKKVKNWSESIFHPTILLHYLLFSQMFKSDFLLKKSQIDPRARVEQKISQ